jgi:hypothetical protein
MLLHDWTQYTFSCTYLGCLYRHSCQRVSITLPCSPGLFENLKAADECVHGFLQRIGMKRAQNYIPRATSIVLHTLELVKFLLLILLWSCGCVLFSSCSHTSSLVNSVSKAEKRGKKMTYPPILKTHLRLETPSSLSGC